MNRSKNIAALALAVSVSALAVTSASAQNPGFTRGDLILGFQTTGAGSANYVLASLGDTALIFRDATSSVFNITNVNSALVANFGTSWFDRTDLFVGTAGVWSNDEFDAEGETRNGDLFNTVYMGTPRQTIGNAGAASSNAFSIPSGSVQNAADRVFSVGATFEGVGSSSVSTISAGNNFVDYNDENPIGAGGVQGVAYDTFSGGVQDTFGPGTFGTFGGVAAEAALDLYRIGSTTGSSAYEGTVVLDSLGNVSFIVAPVPEPSTALMIGLTTCVAGFVRRRRMAVAA